MLPSMAQAQAEDDGSAVSSDAATAETEGAGSTAASDSLEAETGQDASQTTSDDDSSVVLDSMVVEAPEDPPPVQNRKPAPGPSRSVAASSRRPAPSPVPAEAPVALTTPESELATADTTLTSNFDLLRDFPGSATIVDQSQLQSEQIWTLRDLSGSAPNFTAFDGGGNRMTNLSVRGVREQSYQSAPEILPSVAYYIDDVPSLTTLGRVTVFNNIGSIAIEKGPQNTGYGMSMAGGVIDIRSPDPTETASAYIDGSYGNYDAHELTAGISTPIFKDVLYLSADGVWMGRDGFYDNIAFGGDPYGDKSALGGRVRLTAKPWENVTIDYQYQREDFRDQADPYIYMPLTNPDPFVVNFDRPGHDDITQDLQSLRVKADLEAFDFMSVTAYRQSTWDYLADAIQYGPLYADFLGVGLEDVNSFTQEFRVASNTDPSQLGWSGGMFFAHTTMDYEGGFLFNDGTPAGAPTLAETDSRDFAAYGEVSAPVTTAIRVLGGIRYAWAGREGSNEFAPPFITRGEEEFGEVLPSVSVVYSSNPNISYFGKYARAFKPGGFNARTYAFDPYSFEYGEETSDNFEVGVKTLSFAGTLEVNGSIFYSKFHDYQDLTQLSPTTFGISNADTARSYGAEIDAAYQLTQASSCSVPSATRMQSTTPSIRCSGISVGTRSASRRSSRPRTVSSTRPRRGSTAWREPGRPAATISMMRTRLSRIPTRWSI
ncbi:hypothetical protein AUC70_05765 [Methyloceanibacter stevinii]|uniref:TonB-dependent receptor plug domain-containing protein n=1 Tax=Methyloceanibacter stevinii TaxID=1774970 RepID=A0A1E3VNT6_9HYPH|nr:hypothetical protein AUC70_05765 [Methyloceanibacter stevinii]